MDLRGCIPAFVAVTAAAHHEVAVLDEVPVVPGSFYIMDRGYVDFERLYRFTLSSAFFVVRTKSNVLIQRRYSHPVDKATGVRSDHTVILTAIDSAKAYPDALRRVSYLRCGNQKAVQVSHQQLRPAGTYHRQDLQVPLAGGIVLRELDMGHSFGCHDISRISCAESTIGGVAGCLRSATHRSTSARCRIQSVPTQACYRRQLFQANQPQDSGRRGAENDSGLFTDGHFAPVLTFALAADRNRMVAAQRANTVRRPDLSMCCAALIPIQDCGYSRIWFDPRQLANELH